MRDKEKIELYLLNCPESILQPFDQQNPKLPPENDNNFIYFIKKVRNNENKYEIQNKIRTYSTIRKQQNHNKQNLN